MTTEEAHSPTARRSRRRFLGIAAIVLGMGVLGWGYTQGWFRSTPPIPGGHLTEGDPEIVAVVQEARAAVAQEPKSAETWGRLGQVLQVHNYFDPALAAFAEAARLDPRNPDWPYLRATILLVGSQPADAIPDLQRAATLGGLDEIPRLRLGELFLEQGRFEEGSEQFGHVLAVRPNDPRAHLGMAQVAVARQAWAESLRHLAAAGDVPSARKQVCAQRLLVYTRQGDAETARREKDRLAKLPDDSRWPDRLVEELSRFHVGQRARLSRAATMGQKGQGEAAIGVLRAVVADYPKSELAWASLGRSLAGQGDLPAAEQALMQSLDLAPDTADIWAALADVRLRRKNFPGMLDCLRKVNRLKPTDADAHYKVGLLLVEFGDRAGASEAFRQALRYRPDYPEAREGLDKLAGDAKKP